MESQSKTQVGYSGDPFASLPLLIPVPAAAKLIGISRAAAYRFASSGALPSKRLGRRVYVVSARLREFVETEREVA
jgi:predicted DNA-binding transcriptional regulator AlpA